MHSIKNWLKRENIHLHLSAQSELETIWTMLDLAANIPAVLNTKDLAKAIYENEIILSSHRGCSGIVFYALTNAVSAPLLIVGRFDKGMGYFSKNHNPINIVVLLAAPESHEDKLKENILCMEDILCDRIFTENIGKAKNQNDIYRLFLKHCLEMNKRKTNPGLVNRQQSY